MTHGFQLTGLGERTQEVYLRAVRQLAAGFHRPPDQLSEVELREYFLFIKNEKHFSAAALKITYIGIKFFYTRKANSPQVRAGQEKPSFSSVPGAWSSRPPLS